MVVLAGMFVSWGLAIVIGYVSTRIHRRPLRDIVHHPVERLKMFAIRALALNVIGVLGPQDFPAPIGDAEAKNGGGLFEDTPSLAELSRRYAAHVLQAVGGNKSEAARLLEVDRKTFYKLLESAPASEPAEDVQGP